MPKDDEIINAALSGEPNTDEVNYLTLLSSYDGKLTLLQWLKKSVAYYQQGIDQFSADHNQVELNRLNISDLEGRVYTLEQKPDCLPLTGGTLNGGLDVMGRLAVTGKVGQDPMLEVGEGVADSHLSIQANKNLYSRVFTPRNSAYTFAETMRDGVYEWTISGQSNGETKTATYRLPYGANMPSGNHFLALHDEVTAEATTRNSQFTGLRNEVRGISEELTEEITNRTNADNVLTTALGSKADYQELGDIWSLPEGATWNIHLQNSVKIGNIVFTHLVINTNEETANGTILAILNDKTVKPNHAHLFPFASGTKGLNNLGRISNWATGKWDLFSYYKIGANDDFVDIETFFSVAQ